MSNIDSSDKTLPFQHETAEHQVQPDANTEAIDETRHSLFTRLSACAVIAGVSLAAADDALASMPDPDESLQNSKHVYQMPNSEMPDNSKAMRVAADGKRVIAPSSDEPEAEKIVIDEEKFFGAAKSGDINVVRAYLESGRDVNANDGWALRIASKHGYIEIVRLLIENRASLSFNDADYSLNALQYAVEGGQIEVAKLLLENGANANPKINGIAIDPFKTPLTIASEKGNIAMARLLIENDADVNAINKYGNTPLCSAARSGNIKMVRLLIKSGAQVNPEAYDRTPLMEAAANGHIKIVQLLLKLGANVNTIAYAENETALMDAAENGHLKIVQLLLEKGADEYSINQGLIGAVIGAHSNIVRLLLNKEANANVKNGRTYPYELSGKTALEIAIERKYDKIAQLLRENVAE